MEYPSHLQFDVVLRDGSTMHIRPIRPDDKEAMLAFFHTLSDESKYFRFFTIPRPEDLDLKYLTEIDYYDHFALVGELEGKIVAVARYIRNPENPHKAEVGFTIADHLQGKGVGTRLLELLAAIAREHGISCFEGQTLASNHKMMAVFLNSGFDVERRISGGVLQVSLSIAETEKYERLTAERSMQAARSSIAHFFEPVSIAVVGVNRRPGQIGSAIFQNIRASGYQGALYPVNPCVSEIDGYRVYPKVSAIEGVVELAVIAVPAESVDSVVDDCIEKGVKALLVITAGFGETGIEGRRREEALVEKIRNAGIRMVGPNCMGLLNTAHNLNATFAPIYPPKGSVAISSQSGALGLSVLDYTSRLNIGVSSFISIGNKADVSVNDLIQYWAEDPATKVILLYVESFGNPRKFSQLAQMIGKRKPIVAVKSGRSKAGARAALSHTGALATSDSVVDALFKQAGVIRTNRLEEMFDVAALLAHQPPPAGRRVAILTNAGGPGILAADVCEAEGLQLPPLSDSTVAGLRSFLPSSASVANPVDMIASATPQDYCRAMKLILADENIDSLIVIFIPPIITDSEEVAAAIVEGAKDTHKTVLATFMSVQGAPQMLAPLPCYPFPESAAAALARAATYAEWRSRPGGRVYEFDDIDTGVLRSVVGKVLERGGGWVTHLEAEQMMGALRVRVARSRLAKSAEEAACATEELGFPVVLKASGSSILHKTEEGAVVLGLDSREAVMEAYHDLKARLGHRMVAAIVQNMIEEGVEMVVGAVQDPTFGSLVLCGSGGVLVELIQDVAFRIHPLTDRDVDEMLEGLKVRRLLHGYRGKPPVDEGALKELLLRVSAFIELCPEVQEMDINPVKVCRSGVYALDVRIRVDRPPRRAYSRRVVY